MTRKYLKINKLDVERLARELIQEKWEERYSPQNFMAACEDCRIANELQAKELEKYGHSLKLGKNLGSSLTSKKGWSKDGHFYMGNTQLHPSWRGVIPPSLYWYMVGITEINDYWSTDNEEIKKHRETIIKKFVFGDKMLNPRYYAVTQEITPTLKIKEKHGADNNAAGQS